MSDWYPFFVVLGLVITVLGTRYLFKRNVLWLDYEYFRNKKRFRFEDIQDEYRGAVREAYIDLLEYRKLQAELAKLATGVEGEIRRREIRDSLSSVNYAAAPEFAESLIQKWRKVEDSRIKELAEQTRIAEIAIKNEHKKSQEVKLFCEGRIVYASVSKSTEFIDHWYDRDRPAIVYERRIVEFGGKLFLLSLTKKCPVDADGHFSAYSKEELEAGYASWPTISPMQAIDIDFVTSALDQFRNEELNALRQIHAA